MRAVMHAQRRIVVHKFCRIIHTRELDVSESYSVEQVIASAVQGVVALGRAGSYLCANQHMIVEIASRLARTTDARLEASVLQLFYELTY